MAPFLDDRDVASVKAPFLDDSDIASVKAPESLPEKYGWPHTNARGYTILEQEFGTKRPMRVIHIGAGASGICFSKFYEELMDKSVSIQIYDKNADVGGTWLENRYPGCACDIPSVNYQFTWARNPNWSQFYSGAPEIWRYFKNVVDEHGLMKYIKLSHEVIGADWDDEEGLWHVKIRNDKGEVIEDSCNVLINGGGILNAWRWPTIEGLHSFEGKLMHTARYDTGYSLAGKHVAVIGAGSSGIQLVANIQKEVEQLFCWVRSPTWVTAGFAQRFAGPNGKNFAYTEEQKENFRKDPLACLKYSKMIESELNQRFKFILKNTPEAESAKKFSTTDMKTKLSGNEKLCDSIIPKNFGVGCRRPTPGNGFLEALTQENVTVFTSNLKRITEKGFVDHNDVAHEVDVIICATGFDTSWVPRFPVVANGVNLQDFWRKDLLTYLSLGAPGFPNYWMSGGPYGPLGHGSFLPVIETLMKNFIECINKMQSDRIKSLTPRLSISRAFKEHADLFLKRTAWVGSCSSWFKQGKVDGTVAMFPGSRLTYIEFLSKPRFEDYDIAYMNPENPMEFLGNGFSTREFDGRDLSFYLGLLDGEDRQTDVEAVLA